MGAGFARALAAEGLSLVLVDRQRDELEKVCRDLAKTWSVSVVPVAADLAQSDAVSAVEEAARGKSVGLLVNNAAVAPIGPFLEESPEVLFDVVEVNCRAVVSLTHRFGRRMAERGRGGIVFVSSWSAFCGAPRVGCYAASKAFNLVLAESLWAELREAGVDVLAVAPGPTDTPRFRAHSPDLATISGKLMMDVRSTVREALTSLGRRPTLIPGRTNRVLALLQGRLLPRRLSIEIFGRNIRSLYPSIGQADGT
jgi:hypothetical protein